MKYFFKPDEMKWVVPSAYTKITPQHVRDFCAVNEIPNDNRLKICYVISSHAGGVGYYRAIQPAKYLNEVFGDKVIAIVTEAVAPEIIMGWADVVVLGRAHHPILWLLVKNTKAVTVYETDDLLHCVDKENPASAEWSENTANYWWSTEYLEVCDALQVSTEPLLKIYGVKTGKSAVLENAIDPDLFPQKPRRDEKPIRIGWAGSQTHIHDLNLVGKTLARLKKEYLGGIEFVFMGFNGKYIATSDGLERDLFYGVPRDYRDGTPIKDGGYYQALADMNLDIAFAPIVDTVFNRCKSNLKTLEFGALGLPMVVSDVEPYRWSNALERASTPEEWYRRLRGFIDSAFGRSFSGDYLRREVAAKYDIRKRIGEHYAFYKSL